jgi:hypothetical protein
VCVPVQIQISFLIGTIKSLKLEQINTRRIILERDIKELIVEVKLLVKKMFQNIKLLVLTLTLAINLSSGEKGGILYVKKIANCLTLLRTSLTFKLETVKLIGKKAIRV